MASKTKPKPVILPPKFGPDSFTRAALRKALKKLAAARQRRPKSVSNASK